jgi:bifunctional non-homologous end joining protein LigD
MLWRTPAAKRQPPGFIEPCIPTRAEKPPVGPSWSHEIKHDGYRIIARKKDDRVRLFTRRGYDWTHKFPLIAKAIAGLRSKALVIDGEAVYCDSDGVANFEKLHSQVYDDRAFLYAFDLLELGGVDLRAQPLEERKGTLEYVLRKGAAAGIQLNEHILGDGGTIFEHACKLGFEGIVSKHREHRYRSGPSRLGSRSKTPLHQASCGSRMTSRDRLLVFCPPGPNRPTSC